MITRRKIVMQGLLIVITCLVKRFCMIVAQLLSHDVSDESSLICTIITFRWLLRVKTTLAAIQTLEEHLLPELLFLAFSHLLWKRSKNHLANIAVLFLNLNKTWTGQLLHEEWEDQYVQSRAKQKKSNLIDILWYFDIMIMVPRQNFFKKLGEVYSV